MSDGMMLFVPAFVPSPYDAIRARLTLPYPHPTQPYARERNAHPRPFTIPTASLSRHSVKQCRVIMS